MKILLSWLKEYIDIEDIASLPDVMTRAGIEVDHIEEITPSFHGVVAARITEIVKHPHAPKLAIAKVYDGKKEHTVVCSACNCQEGLVTAYAPLGSLVGGKRVDEISFGEVHSHGMLCSEKELGLSEFHEGIVELPAGLKEGTYLDNYFSDILYEVSLTPNLGHCQSIMGIARELSAFLGVPLHKTPWIQTPTLTPKASSKLRVTVKDTELCPRYSATLLEDVHVAPAPTWMRLRLERTGHRSINNIVDITNYISHEFGQPLHAFDADRVHEGHLTVRSSLANESLTFLDGSTKKLPEETIVVADSMHALAAGGIMGGECSSVVAHTKRVILESANFNPAAIRRSRVKLCISTDSSKRFERGADQAMTLLALQKADELIKEMSPKAHLEACFDAASKTQEKKISCRISRTSLILGYEVSVSEMELAFQRLTLPSSFDGQDTFSVNVPRFRHDLNEEVDLIEEVGRIVGLQRDTHFIPKYSASKMAHHPLFLFEGEVRRRCLALGLQEVLTGDLIGPEMARLITDHTIPDEQLVRMLNPLSSEQSILRPSLLPGLLDVLKRNYNLRTLDLSLFEVGHVHLKKGTGYAEPLVVGMLLTGKVRPAHFSEAAREVDFYDLKGKLETLFHTMQFAHFEVKKSDLPIFHPGRQAKIFVNGVHVGVMGELHPQLLKMVDVPERVLFAECDLQELLNMPRPFCKMRPLAIFPSSERDWTITVSTKATFDVIMEKIQALKPSILETVSLVSIYKNEKLGADVQNVTLRFVYRDPAKTISQEEVEAAHDKLVTTVLHYLAEKYPV